MPMVRSLAGHAPQRLVRVPDGTLPEEVDSMMIWIVAMFLLWVACLYMVESEVPR